jgi:glycerol-3-phosphate acyltransferase PlsY
MATLIFILLAYLIGSLSFAVIVSKLFGLPDPRSFGSKNPGATNVLRTGKKLAAVLTLLGDAAKGFLAVFLAKVFAAAYGVDQAGVALAAVAVFVGHIYPVFFRFQGGKGVATALGVLLAIHPWLGAITLATWLLAAYMWRTSSLSALIAAAFAPLYAGMMFDRDVIGGYFFAATVLLSALLIYRHKTNIRNLLAGKEGRLGQPPGGPGDMPPE